VKAKLIEFYELCPDVRHFVFEVPEVEDLPFQAGQFITFSEAVKGKQIMRPYSIASAPVLGNRFELVLNRVPDGLLSPRLFDLNPGDTMEISAPMGFFTLRNPGREAVFVATGTGIAPFRSMLHAHLADQPQPLTLIFGTRYEHGLTYRAEFEEMEKLHSNFRFVPVVSRPGAGWTGRSGHVQQHMVEVIGSRRDIDVYLCGLKLMVDDARSILKGLGFDRKQIIVEKYD
jgi:CDP-4-dehydro-6-deoxyglucose reductase